MKAALIALVWRRARHYCEYCQMSQEFDPTPFEIDHIISEKHKGPTVAGNLCLSCFYCNSFKGSDISSLDAVTRELTPLFNPRRHKWSRHFVWEGPYLVGQTAIGRVTIELLRINDPFRVDFREDLMAEGLFPPE
jgi:5-methylcytosine-specific restriction endonuclease McrA